MERSKGTGFVSFWNLADADKCIEEAERMREDMDPEVRPFSPPNLTFFRKTKLMIRFRIIALREEEPLHPPHCRPLLLSRAARLVLQGRTLDVTRAVSRVQAEKLRETGERAREKQDTRNLYLMREGG